jgi:uncharacterized protein
VSTQTSLGMAPDARIPDAIAGFSLGQKEEKPADYSDADSFFNLPQGDDEEDDDEDTLVR